MVYESGSDLPLPGMDAWEEEEEGREEKVEMEDGKEETNNDDYDEKEPTW